MAPKRKSLGSSSTRRSARRKDVPGDGIPSVYKDMLAEAASQRLTSNDSDNRVAKYSESSNEPGQIRHLDYELFDEAIAEGLTNLPDLPSSPENLQHIVRDDFEGSDGSDAEFEDVDLEPAIDTDNEGELPEQKALQLDLSKPSGHVSTANSQRRKPVGFAERKIRLDIHKMHILCLLGHLQIRNHWCNSESIHSILKPLISRKTTALLHVDESKAQFQRSHSFSKGIEELCEYWRKEWTITEPGIRRAHWRDDVDAEKESEDGEDLIDFEDFMTATQTKRGSRDLGAQIFCALLRSLVLDARLVCSLQVLPFSAVAKSQTPEKPKPKYVNAPQQNYSSGHQGGNTSRRPKSGAQSRKRVVESPFPIYWIEVFSTATSSWIPLDPLVRHTINKPKTAFEPPASDALNSMSYVIAFEEDESARDVTRRYAQWYNAKTRRTRVESMKGGIKWWSETMERFQKPFEDIRDEIETLEFIKRAASEGLPRNVQEFKGHPVYVLERHLRLSEVIHPRTEVGRVSVGLSKTSKSERVFRRQNVHFCRSADAWYRRGRDVRQGEVALKRVASKRNREIREPSVEDSEGESNEGTALYAEYQTEVFEPPPVIDGQIPKNAFGNLDVYVPSMIPAGGIHVKHPLAAQAARILGIGYADAVTGFEFEGRQGTAVVNGAVISKEFRFGVVAVIVGLESQAREDIKSERTKAILGLWKRWLTTLRVMQKVEDEYGGGGDKRDSEDAEDISDYNGDEEDEMDHENADETFGGGFMRDPDVQEPSEEMASAEIKLSNQPSLELFNFEPAIHHEIIVIESPHELPHNSQKQKTQTSETSIVKTEPLEPEMEEAGGFLPEDYDETLQSSVSRHPQTSSLDFDDDEDGGGGGFIPEDTDHMDIDTQLENASGSNAIPISPESQISSPENTKNLPPQPSLIDQASATLSIQGDEHDRGPKNANADKESQSQSPTSLLSHDPEEDDAEPEWLLDVLGDGEDE